MQLLKAMRERNPSVSPNEPHPDLLHRLFFVRQVCLALLIQIAAGALVGRVFAPLGKLLPSGLAAVHISFALAALFAALSLSLSDVDRSPRWSVWSRCCAILTAITSMGSFLDVTPASTFELRHDGVHVFTGIALILISISLMLIRSSEGTPSQVADASVSCLHLLVLVLLSEFVFGSLHLPDSSLDGIPSAVTLASLTLLTIVVLTRRAEVGIFRMFLGSGIAGRIARWLSPFLLLLPFLREVGRTRVLSAHVFPPMYALGIIASLASVVAFGLLISLISGINKMEMKIHDLTLRDELTGLYNVRGFNLLAGQSLRLAQRADVPFSVLFIDMDNLKRVNDEMGHNVGSATLAETAKLLTSTFREADVIARVGGDEFVVAGQFNHEAVAASARRLQDQASARFSDAYGRFPLSLSIGYATSADSRFDSLKELVARADQAMYDKKRRKKSGEPESVRSMPGPVPVMSEERESFAQTAAIHSPS
jgi:diguanylate cyclase (GGDEF)-like protein